MITTQELIDYIYDDNLIHFDDREQAREALQQRINSQN